MKLIILITLLTILHAKSSRRMKNQAPHIKHFQKYQQQVQSSSISSRIPLVQDEQELIRDPFENINTKYINNNTKNENNLQIEEDALTCPQGCVCQYAHFTDLPISRWIKTTPKRTSRHFEEDLINHNDVAYEGDDTYMTNPFIKQATCILQEDMDPTSLVDSLPHDLHALILLYTGIGKPKMVNTSTFIPLNQLNTLEIRGPQDLTLKLIFDKPLSFLQNANFDSIRLMGSEQFNRPKNPIHPSESFDYKPLSETDEFNFNSINANATDRYNKKIQKIQHKEPEIETIIVPYDIYKEEMLKAERQRKKSQMPTFYGWNHLEVLRIRSCVLRNLDWEMFDGLDTLQHLSLQNNDIKTLPSFALFGALHIKTLSLSNNNIMTLHYRALAGLLELETLDLSNNRLTQLSELSFPPFPNLKHIDFRNNPIRYIYPATFWVMNNTNTMQFSSTDVTLELWGNMPFESLNNMNDLSITNVQITNLEQNILKDLYSLNKLKLKGSIRSIEFDAFATLTEIREIDLSECQIQEISMDTFIPCRQLQVINLSKNNLTYIPSGLFDEQHSLEEIYLEGNQLQTLPINFFLLPKLRLARLTDNPWKCNCDMQNWKPKIINQERGARIENCITDFFTGKKLSCRIMDNYKFNNRYAPRCNNYNQRSVFYVLRKHLQCGAGRVIRNGKHRFAINGKIPTWKKQELLLQQQNKENVNRGVKNKYNTVGGHRKRKLNVIEKNSSECAVHQKILLRSNEVLEEQNNNNNINESMKNMEISNNI